MIVCALYQSGPLESMVMVLAKKRTTFYVDDLDCRFLEKSITFNFFFGNPDHTVIKMQVSVCFYHCFVASLLFTSHLT